MDVGKKIADARNAAGLTQQEFADRLFISRDLVSKWENGTRRPDLETFEKIAEVLGIPTENLIRREDRMFEELEACIPNGREFTLESLTAAIEDFLRTLPSGHSQLFMRRYYLLNSNAEIANILNIKENLVRSRLSKTVKKLKNYLKEYKEPSNKKR